jgi:AcrR family transcriptional regulator
VAGSSTSAPSARLRTHRSAQYRATENAIVEATYRLLASNLTEGTTVSQILRESGLSTRAFYHHFQSKDELVLTLVRAENDRMLARLRKVTAEASTPDQALAAWVDEHLAVAYEGRRIKRGSVLVSNDARTAVGYRAVVAEGLGRHKQVLAEILADGKRRGDFPAAREPVQDAAAIYAAVFSVVEPRLFGEPGPDRESARSHLLGLFRRALGAKTG